MVISPRNVNENPNLVGFFATSFEVVHTFKSSKAVSISSWPVRNTYVMIKNAEQSEFMHTSHKKGANHTYIVATLACLLQQTNTLH